MGIVSAQFKRALAGFSIVMPLTVSACSLESMGGASFETEEEFKELFDEESFDVFLEDASDLLASLFPALDSEELAEVRASLDYDQIVSLAVELEAVRKEAAELSAGLFKSAEQHFQTREEELSEFNGGFPESLEALGQICRYDAQTSRASLDLSGVLSGKNAVELTQQSISVFANGAQVQGRLACLNQDETVDIVFLVDITGSMSNVISSVRDSVVRFVDAIEERGVRGTLSVVAYQDTVGVNVLFQEPAPAGNLERSPFMVPVDLSDPSAVERVRSFVNKLEANRGADGPENLGGALDFARNNVIGQVGGEANVIDGTLDPPLVEGFPSLTSNRQVFVALTDSSFHGDDRTELNSSLESEFVPRDAEVIVQTLQQTNSTVHVIDPSWVDRTQDPSAGSDVDADYWAAQTGGLGPDTVEGYSLVDLELVIVGKETGLLDATLDKILTTSCRYEFEAELSASSQIEVRLEAEGEVYENLVPLVVF